MKNINKSVFSILFLTMIALFGYAQEQENIDFEYEVNRVYPPISIKKKALRSAKSLVDINSKYEESWVKTYNSVEIVARHNGIEKRVVNKDDKLTMEQIDLMDHADVGTDIEVFVKYIPDNNLSDNEEKEINFTVEIDPLNEARYTGGKQKMMDYLEANAMSKLPNSLFENYYLIILNFSINEEGQVVDAHIFNDGYYRTKDKEVDKILLEAICNMPKWKPAEYEGGTKVGQDFALTVGNHSSCTLNLVNIKNNRLR